MVTARQLRAHITDPAAFLPEVLSSLPVLMHHGLDFPWTVRTFEHILRSVMKTAKSQTTTHKHEPKRPPFSWERFLEWLQIFDGVIIAGVPNPSILFRKHTLEGWLVTVRGVKDDGTSQEVHVHVRQDATDIYDNLSDFFAAMQAKSLPNDLEALKLLADWSKWCAVIETAAIAAIAAFFKKDLLDLLGCWPRALTTSALVLFALSIAFAAFLLLSLPATVQRLPPPYPQDVFLMGTWEGTKRFRLSLFVQVQTWTFILGLFCFVAGIITACWSLPLPATTGQ